MNFVETKKFADNIEGFLTDKEGELLFNLAKNCGDWVLARKVHSLFR